MPVKEIDDRGKRLRADLTQALNETIANGTFKMSLHGMDFSAVVTRWVHAGMTFGDAEAILTSAGFKIETRSSAIKPNDQNTKKDWPAVIASSKTRYAAIGIESIYVTLKPSNAGGYMVIDEVSASIYIDVP